MGGIFARRPIGEGASQEGVTMNTGLATQSTYDVEGMTCGHCETSIREEVGAVTGVEAIDVSAETGVLVVTHPEVEASEEFDQEILRAVEEAGYHAAPKQAQRENLLAGANADGGCCGGSCCSGS